MTTPPKSSPSQPRWYRLYFALAAFDILTILLSLYLNHRLLAIHANAVAVNQSWAERLRRLADLSPLAGAVNAPGNDVFDSRDVPKEYTRVNEARVSFEAALRDSEAELTVALPGKAFAPLGSDIESVRHAMGQMIAEAELIFSHFTRNEADKAGERMATMDRRFADLTTALGQLSLHIREIQSKHFHEQLELAARLRRFEYLIAFAILLMVAAACFYGHKMASVATSAAAEKEQLLLDLRMVQSQLEQRVIERTSELTQANAALAVEITERQRAVVRLTETHEELVHSSRLAGMAEVATGVLHNVGNVLNSVNVSASLILDVLRKSRVSSLTRAVVMMGEHRDHLGEFLTSDPKGKQLPGFIEAVAQQLVREQHQLSEDMQGLLTNIDHIKQIVAMQQSYAKVSGVLEKLELCSLIEDALRMSSAALGRHRIEVVREFEAVPQVLADRHKVLQILVNLISNAKQALDSRSAGRRLVLRVARGEGDCVAAVVSDNGVGIPAENVTRIFQHGFTTKKAGHGFGLHSGANAAKEMGGSLTVRSDGPGSGATFVLELPVAHSRQPRRIPVRPGTLVHA